MELPCGKKCHKLALSQIGFEKKNVTNWLCHKFCSVQTQTDLITNVTIDRSTNLLNGDNAAEFSKKLDIILSGYGRLETNSNTLFFSFIMEKKIQVLN